MSAMKSIPWMVFEITTDYIKLDSFLKAVNAVGSGGQAKQIIADRLVQVNGQVELRRGRKLYPGDRVTLEGNELTSDIQFNGSKKITADVRQTKRINWKIFCRRIPPIFHSVEI